MHEKPKFTVGAKKNPDGSWDYSKAGVLIDRPNDKITTSTEESNNIRFRSRETQAQQTKKEQLQLNKVREKIGIKPSEEKEKTRERMIQLVLKDGGIRIHTSIEKDISQKGYSGFQNLETRIQDGGQPDVAIFFLESNLGRRLQDAIEEEAINEFIDIRHLTKPVYEEVTIPGKKGFLGMGKTSERIEHKKTDKEEPIKHNDIVQNGKLENTMRITYYAAGKHYDGVTEWQDYSGRSGQILIVEIVLPESSGKEIENELKKDPELIRNIVERVMKEKMLKNPDSWDRPYFKDNDNTLRPPYERWDAQPTGGRIYIQTEDMDVGFHEDAVYKIKS